MANDGLETYLNDHLAGAVSAIQMLERAVENHAGTELGPGSPTCSAPSGRTRRCCAA